MLFQQLIIAHKIGGSEEVLSNRKRGIIYIV